MEIVSTDVNIRSLVFTNQGLDDLSDLVGLDNVEFATGTATATPEPGSPVLAGTLLAIGAFVRLRKQFS